MKRILVLAVAGILLSRPAYAADQGHVYEHACQAYSNGAYSIAFRDLMPFAARGDAWSQLAVAEMLRSGEGTTRNREEALIWYRRSAEQGFGPAQCNLGTSLYYGWGAPADPQAAMDWWLRAARNHNAHAMFNLGTEVARGRYVPRDLVRAYRLLREAATLGYAEANDVMKTLRKVMSRDQIVEAGRMSLHDALAFKRLPRKHVSGAAAK